MKVSIIVPIYNKERYLRKCIESLLSQSYDDIEVLLVNDGSTDKSIDICDCFKYDDRVKVYAQANRGVSAARNLGLRYASGEKIMFVDADDYVMKDYVKKYIQYNEDLVSGGYCINDVECTPQTQVYSRKNMYRCLSRKYSKYIAGPVSKLFDRSIIERNNIRFDESMNFGEDTDFVLRYMEKINSCRFIKDSQYINVITEGTLSRKYVDDINTQLAKIYVRIRKMTNNIRTRAYWKIRHCKMMMNNKKMYKKSKKIGVFTVCGNNNYGNKLQNYAIIRTLSKLGYCAETVWIQTSGIGLRSHLYSLIKVPLMDHVIQRKRRKKFFTFNKELNIKKRLLFSFCMKKIAKRYNYLIVGSDQVWNPYYFSNDNIFLFKNIEGRKIAFSASFGVNDIPVDERKRYFKTLNDFEYISVREDEGRRLVEELSGRKDSEVLVDPTMLLDAKEWDKIALEPKGMPRKYILCYFLGNLSVQQKQEIDMLAKERGCEVIYILEKDSPFYNTGPREFLYLEKNADLICTDSFHSTVFAILYNRPFIVYDRNEENAAKMNSRIDTILSKFKLEDRRYCGHMPKDIYSHNYSKAYSVLEKEKKKALDFLKKSLGADYE